MNLRKNPEKGSMYRWNEMNKDRLSIQSSLRIFLDPTELGTQLLRIAHYILALLRIGMKDSKTPEKIPRSF